MRKQSDALEFVTSLKGGWDCVIFDPPYYNDKRFGNSLSLDIVEDKTKRRGKHSYWNAAFKQKERMEIDQNHLKLIRSTILSKMNKQSWFIEFNNRPLNYKYDIIWYKGKSYGGLGYRILRNCSHIGIEKIGDKHDVDHSSMIREVEEFPIFGFNRRKSMKIPHGLLIKLLKFVKASYVLDPFAGDYSTSAACEQLGLKYDTCDKYIPPPPRLKTFLN